ncbi:MAG: type II toxin-antitoxin system RelE/ParE family toxin [Candidatus Aenigmarchaeota archaeon]|nr:type II toxin-antitoxin system RelE/ParE family toxin [Candidatus Aenigmarchaeota archaeon]
MYSIASTARVDYIFKKLSSKNPAQLKAITKKLEEVVENPHRFKPLSNVMKGLRRIHFGNFVLVYSIDEENKTVILEDFDHHDKIYRS